MSIICSLFNFNHTFKRIQQANFNQPPSINIYFTSKKLKVKCDF